MHSVDPEIVERIVESLRAGTEDEKLHSAEYACALPEDLFETPVGWDTKRRTANAALTQHGLRAEDLSAIRPTLVTNKIVGGCPASLTRPPLSEFNLDGRLFVPDRNEHRPQAIPTRPRSSTMTSWLS